MELKYKISTEAKTYRGHKLYQIVALRNFGNVREGEKGGWIEYPYGLSAYAGNLSHDGLSWVGASSVVYGSARIDENAQVVGQSIVSGHSKVSGSSYVQDSRVSGNAVIYGKARLIQSKITQSASLYDFAEVTGGATIKGHVHIGGNAQVHIKGVIDGNVELGGIANIQSETDYKTYVFDTYLSYTFFRGADGQLYVSYRGAVERLVDFAGRTLYYQPAVIQQQLLACVEEVKQIFKS